MKTRHILIVVTSHGDIEGKPKTGIWFSEFAEPMDIFERAGFTFTVASPRGGPAPVDPRGYPSKETISDGRNALAVLNATEHLENLDVAAFDGVFFPGGHGPMFDLATDLTVKKLIADFWQADKPVGAVCHGPAALLDVRLPDGETLLTGRKATGFSPGEDAKDTLFSHMPFSLSERMKAENCQYVAGPDQQPHVQRDGNLITGQNPASAKITAEAFVERVVERGK